MLIFLAFSFFVFAAYAVLIIYYHRAWNSIPIHQTTASGNRAHKDLRDCAGAQRRKKNIARCIGSLNSQNYPRDCFELIVVDDHSTDDTWKILAELASRDQWIVPR